MIELDVSKREMHKWVIDSFLNSFVVESKSFKFVKSESNYEKNIEMKGCWFIKYIIFQIPDFLIILFIISIINS
jgi:hypothetical protein